MYLLAYYLSRFYNLLGSSAQWLPSIVFILTAHPIEGNRSATEVTPGLLPVISLMEYAPTAVEVAIIVWVCALILVFIPPKL